MTKISLRAYNKEIESLVDRGQLDEAISHCKHIMKFYPKHVNTYRLLGKAYLEAKRFTEASDVLQRVLAAYPDDFIAHIGMSMIREDEKNMDAAIWHMERAFEVQPSHSAVQDELRRLYGRRDGIEPPKVRLTRGALVRMYAKSELYAQAIAEIHNALSEDNKRIDLEAILARMLVSSGNKLEAAEVCSRLVNKSPFCFEANRILETVLPNTRTEDIQTYHGRVVAMEPYAAFLTQTIINTEDVPENSVMLEKFDFQTSSISGEPDWSNAIGVNIQGDTEKLPDWLQSNTPNGNVEGPASSAVTSSSSSASDQEERTNPSMSPNQNNQPDEQVPDWMRAAGWNAGSEDSTPNPDDNYLNSKEESDFGIEPADIPDWLKNVSPEPSTPTEKSEDDNKLELLDSLLSNSTAQPSGNEIKESALPDWLNENPAPVKNDQTPTNPAVELPTWLNEDANQSSNVERSEMPDWLSDLKPKEEAAESDTLTPQENAAIPTWDLPDWLNKEEQPSEQISQTTSEELPDWLNNIEGSSQSQSEKSSASLNWLDDISANKPVENEPPVKQNPSSPPLAEIPASEDVPQASPIAKDTEADFSWLDNLAEKPKSDSISDDLPISNKNELPSFLEGDSSSLKENNSTWLSEDNPPKTSEQIKPGDNNLDWLQNIEDNKGGADNLSQDSEPMPDWLRSIDEKEKSEQKEQPPVENSYALPDWLKSLEKEDREPITSKNEVSTFITEPEEEAVAEILPEVVLPVSNIDVINPEPIVSVQSFSEQPVDNSVVPPDSGLPPSLQPLPDLQFNPEHVEEPKEFIEPVAEKTIPSKRAPKADDTPLVEETINIDITNQDLSQTLQEIEKLVSDGKTAEASTIMEKLIRDSDHLQEIIQFLRDALYRHPIDIFYWQSLGDALARDNKLQEALDAYTKAEELLK